MTLAGNPGGLYTLGRVLRTLLVMSLLDRFADNVRRLRSKKGFSQKALADIVGISVSYVSMLERGQRSPPLETIEKMARALKVTPRALLEGR
jgi:transcriptional regulator with XRE-family HTH domain